MRILVFGATGFCGRAFVKQAVACSENSLKVSVFVRDEERAKKIFSSIGMSSEEIKTIDFVVGEIASKFYSSALSKAIRGTNVIVNCMSSFRSPHNQMSTLINNILFAKPPTCPRLVHFGFPRGLGDTGTPTEKRIVGLVKILSCFKFGPAIRDHQKVLQLLQDNEEETKAMKNMKNIEYTVFEAPRMVESRSKTKKSQTYYGTPGTVDRALQESRVWHKVSTTDAADLILAHLMVKEPLPRILGLSYAKN